MPARYSLGLHDRNTHGGLPREIGALGRLPLRMDVTDLDQVFGAVEGTLHEFERLDILVNDAGIAPENLARMSGSNI
jgi:NADP-dependent 3-hydroxy acid dehydrogenase YdfG